MFEISPLPSVVYGDSMINQANINFDFNEGVLTNESIALIDQPTNIEEVQNLDIELFPNPTRNHIVIRRVKDEQLSYSIFSIDGHKVKNGKLKNNVINLNNLSSGIFIVRFEDSDGNTTTKRIVKS